MIRKIGYNLITSGLNPKTLAAMRNFSKIEDGRSQQSKSALSKISQSLKSKIRSPPPNQRNKLIDPNATSSAHDADRKNSIGTEEKQNIHQVLNEANQMANQGGEEIKEEEKEAVEGDEDAVDEKNEQPIEFDELTHKMEKSVHTGSTSAISHTLK